MQFCLRWHASPLLPLSVYFSIFFLLCLGIRMKEWVVLPSERELRTACLPVIKLYVLPHSLCWYRHLLHNNKEFTGYKPYTLCHDIDNAYTQCALCTARTIHQHFPDAQTSCVLVYIHMHGWRNNDSQLIRSDCALWYIQYTYKISDGCMVNKQMRASNNHSAK